MKRRIKTLLKRCLRLLFVAGQRAGVTILPYHFYSQIPNIGELKKEDYWKDAFSMTGVAGIDIDSQVKFMTSVCTPNLVDQSKEVYLKSVALNDEGAGYGRIEAEFLYCFIRSVRPAKIIQIGCGISTAIILAAAKDEGYKPEIVCVEPFPTDYLAKLDAEGMIVLIREKAQKVDIRHLTALKANDLIFVDSTHTVKPGSEVNKIILEVLPRLEPSVWVHFHDIYFPYDYGRALLTEDLFFWSESTLLHAFLINNMKIQVKASLSFIHYHTPQKLRTVLPNYIPQKNDFGLMASVEGDFPSSIYLRTKIENIH